MRKMIYLFAAASLWTLTSMGANPYKITGKVDGAANGDTVFLQNRVNRNFVKLQSAIIKDGKFVIQGEEANVACRYLTYSKAGKRFSTDFFLEKGNIDVTLSKKSIVTGTPSNDIYNSFKSESNEIENQMEAIYMSMQKDDASITEEVKKAKNEEMNKLDDKLTNLIIETMEKNITNPVGIHLLSTSNYYLGYEKLETLLTKVPTAYQKNDDIIKLQELVSKAKATFVGKMFTDFEMKTPEGNAIKLSDYAGKGKYVLVDFWASWCGPCRKEMPNLVKAYEQYKDKGLEIVGVSLDRDAKSWTGALKQLKMTWVQMSDLKYWDCAGAKLYAVRSIPHIVLLDKDGKILARGLHGEELQAKLAELMK